MIVLSFCIPTLNRVAELRQSLASIIEQSDEGVEIVVVDGGSIDGTQEMVSQLAEGFDRLRLWPSQTRSGVDRDILQSVALARGQYCWLFSDDDRLAPGGLAAVRAQLADNPGLAGISTNYAAYDSQFAFRIATVPAFGRRPEATDTLFDSRERCFAALALHLGFISCQIVHRETWKAAERLRDVTPFCNAWIIVYMIGAMLSPPHRWMYLSRVCVHYRSGNDSFIARVGLWRRQQITHVAFAAILRAFFAPNSPTYRAAITNLIVDRMPRTLAVLKARGMTLGLQGSLLALYLPCYWSYLDFWWRVLPIFAIPGFAFKGLIHLYRSRQAAISV